ncbi:uncharacterized protein LOC113234770 isoform X2 [Hyposmocoma kahamanoa]|uniref:uncharacterized protein LOC113234770 isoform X2 n=1 Tax=Hyposmocoma kahamanoa TaxID=1477025 RepID=UPI000E6D704B|nr:uncharacterized protein LOC113234770 isoform X2 [Hyposmocoma kahamanoa]
MFGDKDPTIDAKIKELIKKRGSIKAKLTQFIGFLNTSKSCQQLSDSQLTELEIRIERLENSFTLYDDFQTELEMLSEKTDELYAEREIFENSYYSAVGIARELLTRHRRQRDKDAQSERTKWHHSTGQLEQGALVIVKEKNLPPLMWLLGRIVHLVPGRDGIARVADVKTKKGTIRRAYNMLCPLPIKSFEPESSSSTPGVYGSTIDQTPAK